MTDAVPARIPFVAGLVTLSPATPNSHATILLRDWGPDNNIGVATIDSASPLCASGRMPEAPELSSNTVVQ